MPLYKSGRPRPMKNKDKVLSEPAKVQVGKIVDRKIHANEENKYFDLKQTIASGTVATDNAGTIVLMSGVQQGVTFSTRLGEVINPQKFEFRLDCTPVLATAAAGFVGTNFRVIIFQDRQIRTSTLPLVSDVLEAVSYNSPLNHININSRRFNILMDKIFQLDPYFYNAVANTGIASYDTQTSQRLTKTYKLKGKICYTNPTTGTERNNIYILYLSDQVTASAPAVNMYSRLIYEDA